MAQSPVRRALATTTAGVLAAACVPAAFAAMSHQGSKQIFIKTLQGKTITLEVNDGDSVGTVKSHIAEIEGIPVDQQQIWLNGQQLADAASALSPVAVSTARPDGQQVLEHAGAAGGGVQGPVMVMQTVAEAGSPRHVRGAFELGVRRTAPLSSIAAAGGLKVPTGSRVTARVTWGGKGLGIGGGTVRGLRGGAHRVVVSVVGRSGGATRAPVLVTAG